MSKTRLTGIAPEHIVGHFGSDAFRYYFMRAIQFGQDGSFSWEDMSARYTAELANGLGNLASRATAMVQRYRGGTLPAPGESTAAEEHLHHLLAQVAAEADTAMCALDFASGISAVRRFIDAVNLYVTEQEPWVVAKDEALATRLDTILYTVCEALRAIATLYNPVMPKAMGLMWEQIGAAATLGPIAEQRVDQVAQWGQLPAGAVVSKGAVLFPRLEEEPA
jgi:methionyl-tRNA synthetase